MEGSSVRVAWKTLPRRSRPILFLSTALLALFLLRRLPPPLAALLHPRSAADAFLILPAESRPTCAAFYRPADEGRAAGGAVVRSIADFGGVGDGRTSNTDAFRRAVRWLGRFGRSVLVVPRGRWVTGSFNLTSNFTLYLEEGAQILGSQDPKDWPVIEALPSYGRGRERPGGRHISLLHAEGVTNLVITGKNGSIDGQGRMWWDMWWNRTLERTRGHLLELVDSHNVLIYNLTFLNSPFWTIHPVYCSGVVIKQVTVLAPLDAPNTDGIDPDSSSQVCIEDCYIESGDDLVAIKSGWDQYGTRVARPSHGIVVRRVSGTTPTCSGVGIGSEMSGGVHDITVEDLHVWDCAAGLTLKTDRGRGGYVANVTVSGVTMDRVRTPIRFSRGSNDHPDDAWDRGALPRISGVAISNVVGRDVRKAPVLDGVEGAVVDGICLRNISLLGIPPPKARWRCEFVAGTSHDVSPMPCPQLRGNKSTSSSWCLP